MGGAELRPDGHERNSAGVLRDYLAEQLRRWGNG
jgi:hypothetical protein